MARSTPLVLLASFFILFSSFATAWPWPKFLPDLDALVVRQNSGTSSAASAQPTASQTAAPASSVTVSNSAKNTGSATGSATESGTGSAARSATSGDSKSGSATPTETDKTSYDARLPAGGITMMTPAASLGAQYYKIGAQITFGWNYTSLSSTPSYLNIFATGKDNSALYTIGTNVTAGTSGVATWDTNGYSTISGSSALAQQTYTLIIFDAESSVSAVPQAGYLAPFKGFTFGMYSAQYPFPSTSLDGEVRCATCSGAMSNLKVGVGFVVAMSTITVLSFTWFAGGAGVIW